MGFEKVSVIGAGVMGRGVSAALASSGHRVTLVDKDEAQLESALAEMKRTTRLYAMVGDGAGRSWSEVSDNIHTTTSLEDAADAEFVVENVTENWEIKRSVHAALDSIISESAIVAVNTSAIPITKVAAVGNHPERYIGMHFMNPVPLMPMVEVIPGWRTGPKTIDGAKILVAAMGKECIVVKDSPGFVTNRVMMQMVNEAAMLVDEGVSTPTDIDRLFKTCFGHKMGPFETADLIGLDTVLQSIEMIQEHFGDSKYRPAQGLVRRVEAGMHGRKSGKGYYDYR